LFLIHRYKIVSVHYLTPTNDNHKQTEGMKAMGIFDEVNDEVGEIIVADVNTERVQEFLDPNQIELKKLTGNVPS
jgi:isocitrate lyase